jgi:hypothetical protein
MKEHGLYILKQDFFDLIHSLGGECDMNAGGKRPVYCCFKDNKIDGMFWAIPTSVLAHRSNEQNIKYKYYLSLDESDLRSCYYHIARTTVVALYKISSCFPVIEKYIEHEFTTRKVHVVMKKKSDINEISRKLKRILSMEAHKPNYFNQRITDIKEYLINDLLNK